MGQPPYRKRRAEEAQHGLNLPHLYDLLHTARTVQVYSRLRHAVGHSLHLQFNPFEVDKRVTQKTNDKSRVNAQHHPTVAENMQRPKTCNSKNSDRKAAVGYISLQSRPSHADQPGKKVNNHRGRLLEPTTNQANKRPRLLPLLPLVQLPTPLPTTSIRKKLPTWMYLIEVRGLG